MAKAIFDLNVQSCSFKDAVQEVLQLNSVDVEQLIGRYDLNICHQKRGVELRVGNALFNTTARNVNLVQQITIFGCDGQVRLIS